MNPFISALLLLLQHAPAATPAAVKTAADIAHGEGGVQKVLTVLDDVRATVVAALTGATDATTNTGGSP